MREITKVFERKADILLISLLFFLIIIFLLFIYLNPDYFFYYLPPNFIYFFCVSLLFAVLYSFFTITNKRKYYYLRLILILFTILFLIGVTFFGLIYIRKISGNDYLVHDSVVLTEEAVNFLSEGKNPYQENYYETSYGIYANIFEGKENPALQHYVYLPLNIVFSLPFSKLLPLLIGFYDQRFVHFLLFILLLVILYKIPKDKENKIFLLLLFSLNPFFIIFFSAGYNDIFVFFWLALSLLLLRERKYVWSACVLGLACVSKQTAFLILPFYFYYIYLIEKESKAIIKIKEIIKKSWTFFVSLSLLIIPFLIWDFKSFFSDIYQKPMGGIESSYPISGIGFSSLLLKLGIINNQWDNYPFWIFQLVLGLIILIILISFQNRFKNIKYVLFAYVSLLFIVWYFGRYFHDSHLGFITYLVVLGIFFKDKEFQKIEI